MSLLIALAFASLIGLTLGLLGGGGSILTVPILVYGLGLDAKTAIATSLFVVGVTSVAAVVPHARSGAVRWRTGVVFGGAGMVGAFVAGHFARFIPPEVLLLGFGVMMIVTAVAMLRGPKKPAGDAPVAEEAAPRDLPLLKVLAEGLVVGGVTGLVGAGGGFLVVPALVLFGGMPMRAAVGTSLVVVAMKSFAGFAGYIEHVAIDWQIAGIVSAIAALGSLAGSRLAGRIPQEKLRKGFAVFVIAMGLFFMVQNAAAMAGMDLGTAVASWTAGLSLMPLLGGGLIGLASAGLLFGLGRVAGISGIFGGLLRPQRGETFWRTAFVVGLVLGGAAMGALNPSLFAVTASRPPVLIGAAGLFVGFGTRLGNGCTSGHGVCGISRLSTRSMVATVTFMATGAVTVLVFHHLLGGFS